MRTKADRTDILMRFLFFVALGVFFPGSGHAGLFEAPGPLKTLVDAAVYQNEGVRQLEAELEALNAEVPAAKALDDPRVILGLNAVPTDTFSLSQEPMTQKQVFITQRFPWFGKLDLRAKRVVLSALLKKEMLRAKKMELRRAVSEAYYDLVYVKRAMELNVELTRMVGQILRVTEAAYAGGKGLQQDIFQAQVELGKLLEEAQTLKSQERSLEDQLNALMNRDTFAAVTISENPKMPSPTAGRESLVVQALSQNPGLAALKSDIDRAGVDIELARKDYRPDVDLSLGYGQRDEDLTGRNLPDFVSGSVSFNIPLWFRDKQDKKLAAARQRKLAAEAAYADLKSRIPFKIDALVREMEGVHENHRLLEEALIVQSDQWARAALSAYEVGKVNFDTLISAQIRKLRLVLQTDRYRASAFKILARLEEIIAVPFEDATPDGGPTRKNPS